MKMDRVRRAGGSLSQTGLPAFAILAALALREVRCLIGAASGPGLGHVGGLLACLALLILASRLWRARRRGAALGRGGHGLPSVRALLLIFLAISLVFLAEETAEGLLRAEGLAWCLGAGGPAAWLVLLSALALAPSCLLADRWFARLETLVAVAGRTRLVVARPRASTPPPDVSGRALRPAPLAFGIARRPPPPVLG